MILLLKLYIGMRQKLNAHLLLRGRQCRHVYFNIFGIELFTHSLIIANNITMPINSSIQLLIALALTILTTHSLQNNYEDYLQSWRQRVPKQFIKNVTQLSTHLELCNDKPCQFYYFLYQNDSLASQLARNTTILLVGNFRGNDSQIKDLLLKSYGTLSAARIIYFPVPNPSGFVHNTSLTFPNKLDIQKDFPLKGNDNCNSTSAFKILQHLFITYPIDLTVYLHSESSKLTYSWNSKTEQGISRTVQFGIMSDIAEWLAYSADQVSQLNLIDKIKTGTSYEQQEGAFASFIDWAYGSSLYPNILTNKCIYTNGTAYPKNTMKGLAFSVGLGQKLKENGQQSQKYLKRGSIILEKLTNLSNPELKIETKDKIIYFHIQGCKVGILNSLILKTKEGIKVHEINQDFIVKGDITVGSTPITFMKLQSNNSLNQQLHYQAVFKCDNGWANLGQTKWAKERIYQQKGIIRSNKNASITVNNDTKQTVKIDKTQRQQITELIHNEQPQATNILWQTSTYFIFLLIGFVVIAWLINCIRVGIKMKKARKLKDINERFEHIEYVQDLQGYGDDLGKQHGMNEDNEQLND